MLRNLRKEIIKKEENEELEKFIGKRSRKFYLEKNYKKNFLYRYLYFLRLNGGDLNKFFDTEINEEKKP